MKTFISHNSADKDTARLLGATLVEQGVAVWFDEWQLRPGDSIVGGIEEGIAGCDVFLLLWSRHARKSNWVTAELRAMLVRRIASGDLRIIPLMLDKTPLPPLVADYKGFVLTRASQLGKIATEITGDKTVIQQSRRLQQLLLKLIVNEFPGNDSIRSMFCPRCASHRLIPDIFTDPIGGQTIYEIVCVECNLRHGTAARE